MMKSKYRADLPWPGHTIEEARTILKESFPCEEKREKALTAASDMASLFNRHLTWTARSLVYVNRKVD